MIGQTLGHYRILDKLGAGGMGEVYLARDSRLDRDVACKILPPGMLATSTARSRFRTEALALAKLNHPNIASIFDFDTQQEVDFLVMEYIAGVSLNDRLAGGALAEGDVAKLGAQLAAGLAAAHEQGVVHRDLKPANMRITQDGRLKILDFGLAKLLPVDTDPDVTTTAAVPTAILGTLPYMAPEQLRGEPADSRTDLYAFGVVLYEMATGRRPYDQKVSTALAADIQYKAPPPPSTIQSNLTARLEEIILKCLEKERENRYQSAREIGMDLARLVGPSTTSAVTNGVVSSRRGFRAAGVVAGVLLAAASSVALDLGGLRARFFSGPTVGIRSLAVLPLQNLSGDASQDYFADGMTESLIANLSRIRALRVISRTSVMSFKRATVPLPDIAAKLGVDAVVEGSVLRTGSRVRIDARLVRVEPEAQLWTRSYERDMSDILALHHEVAAAIASEIRLNLTPQDQSPRSGARVVRPEVYEAYLQGRAPTLQLGLGGGQRAIEFFERALQLDDTYAPAYAALADAHIGIGFAATSPSRELFDKARAQAGKALALDDSLAEAHSAMGWVRAVADWDWGAAEREFKRALDLNPGSASAHTHYATFLSAMGRHDEAIAEATTVQRLDPLSPSTAVSLGWRYAGARKFAEAIASYQKVLEIAPRSQWVRHNIAEAYMLQGRPKEALEELEAIRPMLEAMPAGPVALASIYAGAGQRARARQVLHQFDQNPQTYSSPARLAMAYAFLPDADRTFIELEKAYRDHDVWMIFLTWLPQPDWLRTDPRYLDLVRRMNLPR